MPNVLQPDKTSRENILLFLESVENEDLRHLMQANMDQILAIGSGSGDRDSFFEAINNLIDVRMGRKVENQSN